MSTYSQPGKGWRYDFTLKGQRYTEAWFRTMREAAQAEAAKRKELAEPPLMEKGLTDMDFLELVNRRLDHVKAYNSDSHYRDYVNLAKRWVSRWGELECSQITEAMVEEFILYRNKVSAYTANKEIRYLRAMFNFGIKRKYVTVNPTAGLEFIPVEKKIKYVPPAEDIEKVIAQADPGTQDYLWTVRETMGRISEINRLTWDDVNLEQRFVVLYTRKKKGGHLTPRKVYMTDKLFEILSGRFTEKVMDVPWVFFHVLSKSKSGEKTYGPYKDRKDLMRILCKKAGVKYFRYHALRHAGASIMDNNNVPIGAIQRILGHENRTTTEIYLHSMGLAEKEAIKIYERARQNSHTESHTV